VAPHQREMKRKKTSASTSTRVRLLAMFLLPAFDRLFSARRSRIALVALTEPIEESQFSCRGTGMALAISNTRYVKHSDELQEFPIRDNPVSSRTSIKP